jgi:hypothetical protein
MMLVFFIGGVILPEVRSIASSMIADGTGFETYFAGASMFDTIRFMSTQVFFLALGAWFRVDDLFENSLKKLPLWGAIVIFALGCLIAVQFNLFSPIFWAIRGEAATAGRYVVTVIDYDSILVLLPAVLWFIFFSKMNHYIKQDSKFAKWTSIIAANCFGIYIAQDMLNPVIFRLIGIEFVTNTMNNLMASNLILASIVWFLFMLVLYTFYWFFIWLIKKTPVLKRVA